LLLFAPPERSQNGNMGGDPMIDDEVAAHTRVTVLAYWKFESISLQ
jgi:hypothetical protein